MVPSFPECGDQMPRIRHIALRRFRGFEDLEVIVPAQAVLVGEPGAGYVMTDAEFFGEAADFDRNLLNLLIVAELTADERTEFERRYRERVDDGRPILAGPSPSTDRLTRLDFGADPIRA